MALIYVKYLSILSDSNKTSFLDRFSKSPQIRNFIKFRPVGAGLFHADGETHTNLRQGTHYPHVT